MSLSTRQSKFILENTIFSGKGNGKCLISKRMDLVLSNLQTGVFVCEVYRVHPKLFALCFTYTLGIVYFMILYISNKSVSVSSALCTI